MKHLTVDIDKETARQIARLAQIWGLPKTRHNSPVISRCVERIYKTEVAKQELDKFDRAINNNSVDAPPVK
jgi:hypothetical protein